MQVNPRRRDAAQPVLPEGVNIYETFSTQGEMPHPVVIPVPLAEQFSPLVPGKTWEMLRLALPVVCLDCAEKPIDLSGELLRVATVMILDVMKLHVGQPDFLHEPEPAGPTPALEVLIDALAFSRAKAQQSHHVTLSQPIQMVEQGHQGIAAEHSPCGQTVQEMA